MRAGRIPLPHYVVSLARKDVQMRPIRSAASIFALLALAACADQPVSVSAPSAGAAPLLSAASGRGVAGEYVVVLREGASPAAVAAVAGVAPRHVYDAALT